MTSRQAAIPGLAEAFRAHGYEGASLAILSEATGLGRGSLYNFFPGGKEEMAAAVLDDVDDWFERNIFTSLRSTAPDDAALNRMFDAVADYFASGGGVSLQGAFALGRERDTFAEKIHGHFAMWIETLAAVLEARALGPDEARARAFDVVSGIEGALVLSRAFADPALFTGAVNRIRAAALARAG